MMRILAAPAAARKMMRLLAAVPRLRNTAWFTHTILLHFN
jgi:hypothetical protein